VVQEEEVQVGGAEVVGFVVFVVGEGGWLDGEGNIVG